MCLRYWDVAVWVWPLKTEQSFRPPRGHVSPHSHTCRTTTSQRRRRRSHTKPNNVSFRYRYPKLICNSAEQHPRPTVQLCHPPSVLPAHPRILSTSTGLLANVRSRRLASPETACARRLLSRRARGPVGALARHQIITSRWLRCLAARTACGVRIILHSSHPTGSALTRLSQQAACPLP